MSLIPQIKLNDFFNPTNTHGKVERMIGALRSLDIADLEDFNPLPIRGLVPHYGQEAFEENITSFTPLTEALESNHEQFDIFEYSDEDCGAWDAMVGKLVEKMTAESTFPSMLIDAQMPEKTWAKVSGTLSALSTDFPDRPSRLLKNPLHLKKEGDLLSCFDKKKQARWIISQWNGPERISVEWWMDPELKGFERDYYRVEAVQGEQLWVYSIQNREGFFLHGYFD